MGCRAFSHKLTQHRSIPTRFGALFQSKSEAVDKPLLQYVKGRTVSFVV
jgi:hypothetical protein